MRTVTRITGSYDQDEDRIRFAVLDAEEKPLALWITQRLANRLVRSLVGLLEREVTARSEPRARSSVQLWQQTRADLSMKKGTTPIQAPPETALDLIKEIKIRPGADQVILEFNCKGSESVALPLGLMQLRQFLRMLFRLYGKAEWSTEEIWPVWFEEDAGRPQASPCRLN